MIGGDVDRGDVGSDDINCGGMDGVMCLVMLVVDDLDGCNVNREDVTMMSVSVLTYLV